MKAGRKRWKPSPQDRTMVETMVGYGVPQEAIGQLLGVSDDTLRKHCAAEIELGTIKANAKVAEGLYKRATFQAGEERSNVTAAIFWMKTRAGWRETSDVNHYHSADLRGWTLADINRELAARGVEAPKRTSESGSVH